MANKSISSVFAQFSRNASTGAENIEVSELRLNLKRLCENHIKTVDKAMLVISSEAVTKETISHLVPDIVYTLEYLILSYNVSRMEKYYPFVIKCMTMNYSSFLSSMNRWLPLVGALQFYPESDVSLKSKAAIKRILSGYESNMLPGSSFAACISKLLTNEVDGTFQENESTEEDRIQILCGYAAWASNVCPCDELRKVLNHIIIVAEGPKAHSGTYCSGVTRLLGNLSRDHYAELIHKVVLRNIQSFRPDSPYLLNTICTYIDTYDDEIAKHMPQFRKKLENLVSRGIVQHDSKIIENGLATLHKIERIYHIEPLYGNISRAIVMNPPCAPDIPYFNVVLKFFHLRFNTGTQAQEAYAAFQSLVDGDLSILVTRSGHNILRRDVHCIGESAKVFEFVLQHASSFSNLKCGTIADFIRLSKGEAVDTNGYEPRLIATMISLVVQYDPRVSEAIRDAFNNFSDEQLLISCYCLASEAKRILRESVPKVNATLSLIESEILSDTFDPDCAAFDECLEHYLNEPTYAYSREVKNIFKPALNCKAGVNNLLIILSRKTVNIGRMLNLLNYAIPENIYEVHEDGIVTISEVNFNIYTQLFLSEGGLKALPTNELIKAAKKLNSSKMYAQRSLVVTELCIRREALTSDEASELWLLTCFCIDLYQTVIVKKHTVDVLQIHNMFDELRTSGETTVDVNDLAQSIIKNLDMIPLSDLFFLLQMLLLRSRKENELVRAFPPIISHDYKSMLINEFFRSVQEYPLLATESLAHAHNDDHRESPRCFTELMEEVSKKIESAENGETEQCYYLMHGILTMLGLLLENRLDCSNNWCEHALRFVIGHPGIIGMRCFTYQVSALADNYVSLFKPSFLMQWCNPIVRILAELPHDAVTEDQKKITHLQILSNAFRNSGSWDLFLAMVEEEVNPEQSVALVFHFLLIELRLPVNPAILTNFVAKCDIEDVIGSRLPEALIRILSIGSETNWLERVSCDQNINIEGTTAILRRCVEILPHTVFSILQHGTYPRESQLSILKSHLVIVYNSVKALEVEYPDNIKVSLEKYTIKVSCRVKVEDESTMSLTIGACYSDLPMSLGASRYSIGNGKSSGSSESSPLMIFSLNNSGNLLTLNNQWYIRTVVKNYGFMLNTVHFLQRMIKKQNGLAECSICYYRRHHANQELATLSCKTCSAVFHPSCIAKWFENSVNMYCPMCRNSLY